MRFLLCGLVALALSLPAAAPAALAQPVAPATVEARPDALLVTLSCPGSAAGVALAVDHVPAMPVAREALAAAPPALALVIDRSAPMGAAGAPGHARLDDALQLARMLLALAPPAAPVAIVAAGATAEVMLPLTTDRAAAEHALRALNAASADEGAPVPLDAALALAAVELEGAPGAPRAVVVLGGAAGPFALAGGADAPPDALTLLVGLGPPPAAGEGGGLAEAAARLGVASLTYADGGSAALPALRRALKARLRPLLDPGERVRLTLPPVGSGAHLLTVTGCGAPLAIAFEGPPHVLWLGVVAGSSALALGAGLGAWRRRRRVSPGAAALPPTTEARRQAAAAITTARRAGTPVSSGSLRALLWDGRGRRAVPLEGRHWTIGSDPGCAVRVEGEGIAPLHARLSATGDGLTITDLEGAGGTRVGLSERVLAAGVPTPLAEGELVVLGQSLRLMVERVWADPDSEL